MQKLYCYVDESGQDINSKMFVVVTVVVINEKNPIHNNIRTLAKETKVGRRKWRKTKPNKRIIFLKKIIKEQIGEGKIYYGCYKKPLPYFLPYLDVLEEAIKHNIAGKYKAMVYIDGIDRKKAREMTNALRARGISLILVKSRRDESEPLIRLSDMWAGCIRSALLKDGEERKLIQKAKKQKIIKEISKTKTPL